jgi:hypothetical protein
MGTIDHSQKTSPCLNNGKNSGVTASGFNSTFGSDVQVDLDLTETVQ